MYYGWIKSTFAKIFKRQKINKRKILGAFLITAGLILVLAKPYSDFKDAREISKKVENIPQGEDFDHGPIKADEKLLSGEYVESLLPRRVIIPSLSLDVVLKPAKVVKGRWEVFEDTGSFGLGSVEPGKSGNTVIFAHARKGLFLPLKDVKLGMRVYVFTDEKWFSYEVKEIKEVMPKDVSVIGPTDDETLTLYTCSGFSDSKRLIVVAKRAI